jgi:hypothetical protein
MKKTRKEQLRDIRYRKDNPQVRMLDTAPEPVIIIDSLPAHVGVDLAASYDSEARVSVVTAARRGRWSSGLAATFGSLRNMELSTEEASTALARFQDLYATLNPDMLPRVQRPPRRIPPVRPPRPQHLIAAFHALGYNVNNHADAHVLTPQQLQRGLRVLRLPVPGNLSRPNADLAPSVRALCDGLGIPCVSNPNRQRITPTITDHVDQPRMSEETVEADFSSLEERVTATLAAEISRQVNSDIARVFGVENYEPEVRPPLTAEMLQSIAGSIMFETAPGVVQSVHDSYVYSTPRRMPDAAWRPLDRPTPAEEYVPPPTITGCKLPKCKEPDNRAFRKAGRRNLRLRAYDKPTGEGD